MRATVVVSRCRLRGVRLAAFAAALGFVVLGAGAAAGAQKDEVEKLRAALREREVELETLLRRVPPELHAAEVEERLRRFAEIAELRIDAVETGAAERLAFADGRPSPVRLDRLVVSGGGRLLDLRGFLGYLIAGDVRLRDLETLEVERERDGGARFRATLAYLSYLEDESLPVLPRGQDSPLDHARADLARIEERLRVLGEWARRSDAGRLADAAALLGALGGPEGVQVTGVRIDSGMAFSGALVGAAARAGLLAGLEEEGLSASRIEIPATGACRPFTITVRRGAPEAPPEVVAGAGDGRAAAVCAVAQPPRLGALSVRGDSPGEGALAIELRDADLADLLLVLYDTAGESFVVDHGLAGRLDATLAGATVEAAIAALDGAGIAVGAPPLRRVSRSGVPESPPTPEPTGDPVHLAIRDGDLRDLLCLFEEITGLPVDVEPGLSRRATVFARELPWDLVFEALVASAGLQRSIYDPGDGPRVYVGASAAAESPGRRLGVRACEAREPLAEPLLSAYRPTLEQLGAADLTLAGVARVEGSWRAYVHGPWRQILRLDAGQRLFDARVESIDVAGVALASDAGGTHRLTLSP